MHKDDRHLFVPVMDYFTREEKDAMLKEEYEFDRKFIHQRYQDVVSEVEGRFE